jgi:hypothetical protein
MLRLPDKMAKREKMQRMEKIIDELDIRKCLDTGQSSLFKLKCSEACTP